MCVCVHGVGQGALEDPLCPDLTTTFSQSQGLTAHREAALRGERVVSWEE